MRRSRSIGVGLVAALAMATLAGPASRAGATLYDQTNAGTGEYFFPSNSFPSGEGEEKLADDFTVPAGQSWKVKHVYGVPGIYVEGYEPPGRVNIDIYADLGGLPGAALYSARGIPATNPADYSIAFGGAPQLAPGTYWIAVQEAWDVEQTLSLNWDWGWMARTVQSGNPAALLSARCPAWPNWQVRADCVRGPSPQPPDQIFGLDGTATLFHATALATVRKALARRFTSWRSGHTKRVACLRKAPNRFRCKVSWLRGDRRFAGIVSVWVAGGGKVKTKIKVRQVRSA